MNLFRNGVCVIVLALCMSFVSCESPKVEVVSQDLKFCESVLSYKDGMLIANFGASVLNPLNEEGKGYIKYYADGEMRDFIAADGVLSAPKGMMVCGDRLYVADVNKVVVYDLSDLSLVPHVMAFPEGEVFVNHMVQVGGAVLVSVTNTGNIYSFDVNENSLPVDSTLGVYTNVIGANGLVYDKGSLYIASYPADGNTTADNVIYRIADLSLPVLERVTEREGQYDGLALVGEDLYFTDWVGGVFGKISLLDGTLSILNEDMPIGGPAEIDVVGDRVCVPDLVNSRVYMFRIDADDSSL